MAQNEYPAAKILFELADELERGLLISRAYVEEKYDCSRSAAVNRLDWLEDWFGSRLDKSRNERGQSVYRLQDPRNAPRGTSVTTSDSSTTLMGLVGGQMAVTALDHLRGSQLHTAVTGLHAACRSQLQEVDYGLVDRVGRAFDRYEPIDIPDRRSSVVDSIVDAIWRRRCLSFDYRPLRGGIDHYGSNPTCSSTTGQPFTCMAARLVSTATIRSIIDVTSASMTSNSSRSMTQPSVRRATPAACCATTMPARWASFG